MEVFFNKSEYRCEFCNKYYSIYDMKELQVNGAIYDACKKCSIILRDYIERLMGKL